MLFAIIVALIIGLVIVAIVANTMQQQREKQEAERRQELAKYRAIIDETEEVILNEIGVPISTEGHMILHRRVLLQKGWYSSGLIVLCFYYLRTTLRIVSLLDASGCLLVENTSYSV